MRTLVLAIFLMGAASPKVPREIDLNEASAAELMQLPGIGHQRADAILRYREKHRFRNPAEVMRVKGFKARAYAKLKPYLKVAPG